MKMPHVKHSTRNHPGKLKRDFAFMREDRISRNYLKYYLLAMKDMEANYGIKESEMKLLLFFYDFEFFTIKAAAEFLNRNEQGVWRRFLRPFTKAGWLDDNVVARYLGDDPFVRQKYLADKKKRWTLSKKARLLVQRFYRKLEGEDQINLVENTWGVGPNNEEALG